MTDTLRPDALVSYRDRHGVELRPGALVAYRDHHGVSRGPAGILDALHPDGTATVTWDRGPRQLAEDETPEDVAGGGTSTVPADRLEDIGDPVFPAGLPRAQGFRTPRRWPAPLPPSAEDGDGMFHVEHSADGDHRRECHADDLRAEETRNEPWGGWS